MFFKRAKWLYGVGVTLETLRRGYIGGSALSLFIIKEFGLDKQAVPTLNWMRTYLNIEEQLLTVIPPPLSFLLTPFTDFHDANKTYVKILEILAELQRPSTCQYYWEKGD